MKKVLEKGLGHLMGSDSSTEQFVGVLNNIIEKANRVD